MIASLKKVWLRKIESNINRTEQEAWGTLFEEEGWKFEKGDKNWEDIPHQYLLPHISFSRNGS